MSNSMVFNGIDLSSDTYGVTVTERDTVFMPPSSVDIVNVPYSFGGLSDQSFTGPVELPVPIVIEGTDNKDLHTKMDALQLLFFQRRAVETTLRFDTSPERYYNARLVSNVPATPRGVSVLRCSLTFLVPDPRLYSTTETTQTETITSTPDSFTFPASGTTGGTATIDPVWYIRRTDANAAVTVILNNTTATEALTRAGTLEQNRWLKIDSSQRVMRVWKSDSTGADPLAETYTTAMAGVSGVFPRLAPGVASTITVTGITTGTLTAIYRERYMGE